MYGIAVDRLINKVGSFFKLVVLASKRTLELSDGNATKLVDCPPGTKPQNIALQEIFEGKITYKAKEKK